MSFNAIRENKFSRKFSDLQSFLNSAGVCILSPQILPKNVIVTILPVLFPFIYEPIRSILKMDEYMYMIAP